MSKIDPYLAEIREDPNFHALIDRIKKKRPAVPTYDPHTDNTETWKANSMIRKGFDLCLIELGEKPNE